MSGASRWPPQQTRTVFFSRDTVRVYIRYAYIYAVFSNPAEGGGLTLEVLRVRETLVEDEDPQPPPLVEEEQATPHLRVSCRVETAGPLHP